MANAVRRITRNEDEEMDRLAGFMLDKGRYPWDVMSMSVVSNEFLRMSDTATNARRGFWIRLGLIGAAALFVALLAWRLTQALTVKHVPNKDSIPTVSVTEVGVSTVPTTVSIIGTIAARYDMPIGVEGDAGRVAAIYVEAGDHVKRGQVLARLNVSVLEPQVANLEAALEQARAEAELAEAEYRRAQAVGASGALSAEETQRRKSAAVTAGREGQGCGGAAGGGAGAPGASRGARAGRRHHPDPQCRSGADGDAGRRSIVPPVGRRRSRACADRWPSRTCRC